MLLLSKWYQAAGSIPEGTQAIVQSPGNTQQAGVGLGPEAGLRKDREVSLARRQPVSTLRPALFPPLGLADHCGLPITASQKLRTQRQPALI